MRTIFSSLAVCLTLLAGWHLLVNRLPTRYRVGGDAGSQVEQNVMRGESFVYAQSRPRVVVVGSSISNRLKDLPRDWFNLSFNGGSAFTGMEMILRSGKVPDVVLIETNVLMHAADDQQLRSLFSPGLYQARRRLAFLRETNKPHLIAQRALIDEREDVRARDKSDESAAAAARIVDPQPEPDAADVALPHEQFEKLRVRRSDELDAPLPPEKLDEIVRDLQRSVAELEKRGSAVVFFEMPEHADFMGKPRPASVRERLRKAFPEETYRWVPAVDAAEYRTTDFVHLTARGAKRYADVLKRYVDDRVPAIQPPTEPPAQGPAVVRASTARADGVE